SAEEKTDLRTLAVALQDLSSIQQGQGSAVCVSGYREALSLTEKIGDTQAAAILAFNLGHAYKNLDGIRDLALSEQWYRRSLDARAKEDRMGRAKCLAQLGSVARRRFGDAREANRSREVCLSHLATAERSYLGALGMFPANAVRERDAVHNQLGNIYRDAGQV